MVENQIMEPKIEKSKFTRAKQILQQFHYFLLLESNRLFRC